MLDDFVVAASLAVLTGSVIVMFFLLRSYRLLVIENSRSSRLAGDISSYLDTRLKGQDERILDLLARVELLSVRKSSDASEISREVIHAVSPEKAVVKDSQNVSDFSVSVDGETTESVVLRLLLEGSKSSVQIAQLVRKSREHAARIMKSLFDKGYVRRDERKKPFLYELTNQGRSYLEES
jgi:predicted transcriptional regulator